MKILSLIKHVFSSGRMELIKVFVHTDTITVGYDNQSSILARF